jgi:glycogen debranching enzyme
MARAYLDLSALAGAMMLGSDRDTLLQRGEEIQNTINTAFRDPSVGLYLDRVHKGEDLALSTVHTPASVIPTALGLADDLGAQATTDFILDGNALWGTWQGSDEFMMAVPSVAYHDPGLSVYEDGHRQKGQVWPWQVYMAWRALIFGGAFDQAERLRHRFLEMVAAYADEGLYECYNFLDGAPGFGPQGRGVEGAYAPAIIQHAVTAAAVLRILFRQ